MKIIDFIFKIFKIILIVFFLFYPVYSLFLITFLFLNFFIKFKKTTKFSLLIFSTIFFIFSLYFNQELLIKRLKIYEYILLNFSKIDLYFEFKKYIFYFDNLYFFFLFFVISYMIFTLNFKTKKSILLDEKNRNELYSKNIFESIIYFFNKKIKKNFNHTKEKAIIGYDIKTYNQIDINEKNGHIFAVGTTGSGKTATITNLIEQAVEYEKFTIVVDGKSDKTIFSLYDSALRLAEKYNRKIYIVSQGDDTTDSINPFKNCDSTQIKDMLISLSEWSEEHYKANASRFWQALADLMILSNKNISIKKIIENSEKKNYISMVNNLKTINKISDNEAKNYLNIYNLSSEIALSSVARFATLIEGKGGNIFSEDGFDLIEAYNENAIVIYLIDKFKFPEFSKSLGEVILLDIKKLISKLIKLRQLDKEILVILDELGVYASDKILDILNKSRVAKVQAVLSTQSMSDLDDVTSNFKKQVIDNCNTFLILRNNDPENSELLSGILGTKKKHFTTYQANTESTFSTGSGSFKIVDEYIINPNAIKKLKKLTGIYYSKNTEEIKVFESRLADLS